MAVLDTRKMRTDFPYKGPGNPCREMPVCNCALLNCVPVLGRVEHTADQIGQFSGAHPHITVPQLLLGAPGFDVQSIGQVKMVVELPVVSEFVETSQRAMWDSDLHNPRSRTTEGDIRESGTMASDHHLSVVK